MGRTHGGTDHLHVGMPVQAVSVSNPNFQEESPCLATVVKRANMSVFLLVAEKRMNWGFEGVPLRGLAQPVYREQRI